MVASDGIEIVGFGHARGDRIGALYVLRPYQRRGIGKALLTHLLASLKELSVAEARFDVVAINDNAIAFYRAYGAYPIGRSINRDARGDTEDLVFRPESATREEIVLIADNGGGTSDFTVIRIGPNRRNLSDRTSDILAYTGVRIGGTMND